MSKLSEVEQGFVERLSARRASGEVVTYWIKTKEPLQLRFTRCPPGDGEPQDPGWECHKPTERPGFRELDEYDVDDIGNEGDWG